MTTLTETFRNFDAHAKSGALCKGDDCYGWHYSDLDTWHECSCNVDKGMADPEVADAAGGCAYIITINLNGKRWCVDMRARLDHARDVARRWATNRDDVKLQRVWGDDVADAALQAIKYEDWATD